MAPRSSWYAVFLLLYTNSCCAIDSASTCDSSADTGNALMCESLFKTFENALLSNGSNLYKLKKLFHANPPELASISYYLELDSNWLNNSNFEGSGTSGELPLCSCEGSSIFNQTIYMYDNATIRLRYGWTTIGVYTFIHPALLNQLQIQLPFIIMKIATDRFPFLWDGHNQLPNTNLHLFIPTNKLSCIPCNSQLDGVMKTLTSLVSSLLMFCSSTCMLIYYSYLCCFLSHLSCPVPCSLGVARPWSQTLRLASCCCFRVPRLISCIQL